MKILKVNLEETDVKEGYRIVWLGYVLVVCFFKEEKEAKTG